MHLLLITILVQNILLTDIYRFYSSANCHTSGNQDICVSFLSPTTSSLHRGLICSISTLGFMGCEVHTQFLPPTHVHISICSFVFFLFYLKKLVQFSVNHGTVHGLQIISTLRYSRVEKSTPSTRVQERLELS